MREGGRERERESGRERERERNIPCNIVYESKLNNDTRLQPTFTSDNISLYKPLIRPFK